ncbi:branched-chain amino acid ABC transporter permease [Actinoplanes sp. ATCC 53533]|uniref:branched-chain amino acid ABC transporter permease n=1 Tax=Actinoplanes sp. ATCC 53533 TaxID=1288362 RepID=UPI000F78AF1D|nr:branched-chain amino acid ABC transporter permease [Actinoplanes sp. ATCC 53533]RSM64036.1 branched-chain amino acid ABC transporter permease [Actinoplanes sp. ATCC 53533]
MTPTTVADPPITDTPAQRVSATSTARGAALLAAALVAAVALPAVVDSYTVSIASTALVLATLAMSAQIVTGLAGLPTMGQAAYLGVGAYTAALLANAGLSSGPAQLVVAAAVGAAAAAVTAPFVLRSRGTAFLMVTFAVGELARTVASKWATVTGGDDGLHAPPVTIWPGTAPLRAEGYIYLYLLGCFLILAAAVAVLLRTRLALVLRGAADHEPRLGALGHHVTRSLFAGWTAAGAVAGGAGALLIAANRHVSPADMHLDMSALALLAAAIGVGTMRGAVAGAVLIVVVRDLIGAETGGHALALVGLAFLLTAYRRPITARLRTWTARRRA